MQHSPIPGINVVQLYGVRDRQNNIVSEWGDQITYQPVVVHFSHGVPK